MIDDRDTTRIVRSWLEVGATSLPDRVLDDVLDQLPATRQRRARWPAWRTQQMSNPLKIALAAVVVGVLALVGIDLAPRSGGVGGEIAAPSPTPSPVPLPDTAALEAGATYFIDDAWGLGSPRLIVTVPAMGWFGAGSDLGKGVISATSNSVTVWLTPWNVENLYVDPCHSRSQGLLDPAVGPTVADLANALVQQAGPTGAEASDVTLGGHPGKRVELSLPAGLDLRTCEQDAAMGGYLRWQNDSSWPGGYVFGDGQLNVVYILDLDGQRAVIDTVRLPGASDTDIAELEGVIASVRFESRATPEPTSSPLASQDATDVEVGQRHFYLGFKKSLDPLRVSLTTPPGWRASGYGIGKDIGTPPGPHPIVMNPWIVRAVYADPCNTKGETQPSVGPTIDDLADALVRVTAADPSVRSEVEVGGHRAIRLELSLPAGLDIAACDDSDFEMWLEENRSGGLIERDGGHNLVHIIDVDGRRAVIDAVYGPDTPEADVAEVDRIIASARFELTPGSTPGT